MLDNAVAAFPTIIVMAARTTFTQQNTGPYAREASARGHVAIAFDFRASP
ncbi:hypothetical protein [Ciceribacter sp. L1K22]|nr:hypothetical protein [Ciceribacter sp. L1K22]MBO3760934.1 hypothetical protein [Ciceribacter sp. L1K22]